MWPSIKLSRLSYLTWTLSFKPICLLYLSLSLSEHYSNILLKHFVCHEFGYDGNARSLRTTKNFLCYTCANDYNTRYIRLHWLKRWIQRDSNTCPPNWNFLRLPLCRRYLTVIVTNVYVLLEPSQPLLDRFCYYSHISMNLVMHSILQMLHVMSVLLNRKI